ncbi:hypothetical protein [Paraburkholderia sp. A1RO-5L]|uniref:hypothetical protein n=1 Tax=Paraburkholderia sp. A1RO-5L TaxID=3028370 RepID=UPI003B7669DC
MSQPNELKPATALLAEHGVPLKTVDFHRLCLADGILVRGWRESGKPDRDPVSFWLVGPKGEPYAVEIKSHLSPEPVVRFRADKFGELIASLRVTLAWFVREGEIVLRAAE